MAEKKDKKKSKKDKKGEKEAKPVIKVKGTIDVVTTCSESYQNTYTVRSFYTVLFYKQTFINHYYMQ